MSELDTVDDFVRYLSAKEAFVRSGQLLSAAGEEDLLAYYLQRIDARTGAHGFAFDGEPTQVVIDNFWELFIRRAEYVGKKAADRISYVWDRMIESIAKHAVSGTLMFGSERPLGDHERGLRLLASEGRVARRAMSRLLEDMFARATERDMFARSILEAGGKSHGYVFMTFRRAAAFGSEEGYRAARSVALHDYCEVVKLRAPATKLLVGLAFGAEPDDASIDLVICDFEGWTDADARRAEEIRERRRWSEAVDLPRARILELEYPAFVRQEAPRARAPRPPRARASDKRTKRKAQRDARKRNR